jgi:hypothetical protein
MKFLFLDMDGVLCTIRSHVAADPNASGLMVALDPIGVQLVNRICEASGAKIVLSTAWRVVYGIGATITHLRAAGLHNEHILWTADNEKLATPSNRGLTSRGNEIKEYLSKNEHEAYCILDDDTDFLEEQKPFFVRTHFANGIMWEHVNAAVDILGGALFDKSFSKVGR